MNSNFTLPRGIVAMLLTLLPLSAQEPGPAGIGKFRTLGCRITVEELSYAAVPEEGSDRQGAPKEGSAGIFDSTRSDWYDRLGSRRLVFYRKALDADGKPIRRIIAEADLGKGGSSPLILFLPDPTRPEHLRTIVMPDDPQSFPDTSCRFINLTPATLKVALGKSTVTLTPAGLDLVKTGIGEKPETRFATVSMADERRLYSNNWVFRPGQRTLVIIYPVNGTTEVHRIADTANLL